MAVHPRLRPRITVAGAAISHVEGVPPLPCVAADVRTVYLLGDSLMASRTFRSSLGQHQRSRDKTNTLCSCFEKKRFVFFDASFEAVRKARHIACSMACRTSLSVSRALEYLELSDISRSDIYRSRIQMA